jgi:hypothetical protein
MSSTSHLVTTPTSETKIDKQNSIPNLRSLPCDGLSNLLHLSSSPTTNSKYLYYVNAEPTTKQITTIPSSPPSPPVTSTQTCEKLNPIPVTVPWYKRTRSPSLDKTVQKTPKMSRDRLLPLDKLLNNTSHATVTDEEQASPTNDLTPLDESIKLNEKNLREIKENGYLRNSSHLATR